MDDVRELNENADTINPEVDRVLRSIFYDITPTSSNPAAFTAAEPLHREARKVIKELNLRDVKDWLSGELSYTLHRSARRNFLRKKYFVTSIDEEWQADLADMQEFKQSNDGYAYILTVIDVFSKYAHARVVKFKQGKLIAKAFLSIFKDGSSGRRIPCKVQTDQGTEFLNEPVKTLFRNYNIHHFTSRNTDVKCSIIERFNRTLKTKRFKYFTSVGSRRYVDVLQSLIESYNNSKHRSIGMAPAQVDETKSSEIFQKLYGVETLQELHDVWTRNAKTDKIGIQSTVRKQYKRTPFDKAYLPMWTDQIFKIKQSMPDVQNVRYRIEDEQNQETKERPYVEQIQKIKPLFFRVESIVKRRTRKKGGKKVIEVLVKWLNYPESFNSWVPETDVFSVAGFPTRT